MTIVLVCYTYLKMTIYGDKGKVMNKAQHYQNAYRNHLLSKIQQLNGNVFTRADLSSYYSNQEQLRLNRALNAFIDQGYILKISHGLYAKAMQMKFPNGQIKTVLQAPFETVAIEALNKLKIQWEFGKAIQEYNRGETTQVPAVFSVRLHSRFRGSIKVENRTIIFEDQINAR